MTVLHHLRDFQSLDRVHMYQMHDALIPLITMAADEIDSYRATIEKVKELFATPWVDRTFVDKWNAVNALLGNPQPADLQGDMP